MKIIIPDRDSNFPGYSPLITIAFTCQPIASAMGYKALHISVREPPQGATAALDSVAPLRWLPDNEVTSLVSHS
jgi:hypothetical protein